jgi:hypothetical protein
VRRLPPLHRFQKSLALAALAPLLLAGCGSSKEHLTARDSPLVSIFEAPLQLGNAPGPTLDYLRQLGVDDVRVILPWSRIAPDPTSHKVPAGFAGASPAAYPEANWAPYDAIIRAAAARKMGVLLNVSGPAPLWASARGAPPGAEPGVWKPSEAQFRLFVHAVGVRYAGHYAPPGGGGPLPRVSFWSIWNEPNLGEANLAPQAIDNSRVETSPQMYRALLDGAWSSLQATGHGQDTILIGELAPYGQTGPGAPGNFGEMAPMRFVRALYCVNVSLKPLQGTAAAQRGCPTTASASQAFARQNPALFHASGFALHPYASGETAPPTVVLPAEPDFVYLATLPRIEHFLDSVTSLYGAARQYVLYSTEYGYFTNPPSPDAPSLARAAAYLNQAEYISWRTPRLRSWDQYLLADPTPGPSQFTTGLQFAGGQPKPIVFDAWRMPLFLPVTREPHGHGLEVWGDVRPMHYTSRPQDVHIQLQPAGHGGFETVETVAVSDANGYFDTSVKFPSGGQVRLTWSYPHGPTIHSRLVTISVG